MAKAKLKYARVKYKWLYTHTADVECDDLRDFVYTMSGGIDAEAKKFESLIDRVTAGMEEDRANDVAQQYADEAFGIYERYPRLLWQSVFMSLYAFFDETMNDICRRVRRVADIRKITVPKLSVPEPFLSGQPCLARYGIRLAVKSGPWKRFLAYKAIRNVVAHNLGNLKDDPNSKTVRAFARRHANITIERGRIILNSAFCLAVVEDMRLLLTKTIKSIPNKLFEYEPPMRDVIASIKKMAENQQKQ